MRACFTSDAGTAPLKGKDCLPCSARGVVCELCSEVVLPLLSFIFLVIEDMLFRRGSWSYVAVILVLGAGHCVCSAALPSRRKGGCDPGTDIRSLPLSAVRGARSTRESRCSVDVLSLAALPPCGRCLWEGEKGHVYE